MGRNSRSRQVQQKKQQKATPAGPPREVEEESGGGGSLMSMREGFKNIAGVNEKEQKGGLASLITWVLLAVVVVALVLFFVRR